MANITLNISGMMCGNCQQHIHDTLSKLDGVEQVEVSLEKEEAIVEYNEKLINEKVFEDSFKDSNYTVAIPSTR